MTINLVPRDIFIQHEYEWQAVREAAGMRFVSAKHGGLGLGLALTNATSERFHGSLRADPAPGGGTLTHLTLPRTALNA